MGFYVQPECPTFILPFSSRQSNRTLDEILFIDRHSARLKLRSGALVLTLSPKLDLTLHQGWRTRINNESYFVKAECGVTHRTFICLYLDDEGLI